MAGEFVRFELGDAPSIDSVIVDLRTGWRIGIEHRDEDGAAVNPEDWERPDGAWVYLTEDEWLGLVGFFASFKDKP